MEPSSARPERPQEPLKAQIYDQIVDFVQDSERLSHAFSPKLTRTQREVSPQLAEKFGLFHINRSQGKSKYISIHKSLPQISVGRFADAQKTWSAGNFAEKSAILEASEEPRRQKFSILTLNVLADRLYVEKRERALLALLEEQNVDFVLLQEVSPDLKTKILRDVWVQKTYWVTDADGDIESSGLLCLSKIRPVFCGFTTFRTSPKAMILLKVIINGSELSIINLHLKAGMTSRQAGIRAGQIAQAIELLEACGYDDAIIGGDFNIPIGHKEFPHPDDQAEEIPAVLADRDFEEVWPRLHPDDDGLTYDYIKNDLAGLVCDLILKEKRRQIRGNRFDRFYTHKENRLWTCKDIKLLGTESIGVDNNTYRRGVSIFLSDHFAVRADFEMKSEF